MIFETEYVKILNKIDLISPSKYGSTRNYVDGAVTYISPYISRGMLSTRQIFVSLATKGFTWQEVRYLVQQLAWREYFQRIWQAKKEAINFDIKQPQTNIAHKYIPTAIVNAKTGINAIDKAIHLLYQTGYMHNHLRLYVASVACNIGLSYWQLPAKWMYFHLLDADWASNACSWQWVCGAFSAKKYYANQDNIHKYTLDTQKNTFLDTSYEALPLQPIPSTLIDVADIELKTILPKNQPIQIILQQPIFVYNVYQLDPEWRKNEIANRILLLEPSHFEKYPMSAKTIDFIIALSKNIKGIQILVSEFADFKTKYASCKIVFKEHPLFQHYEGMCDARDWMCESVQGYHHSFFNFWKKCEPMLIQDFDCLKTNKDGFQE